MIKLKTEVNKTQIMLDIRAAAEKMYSRAYEPELRIEDFVNGAEYILNKLRLPDVSVSLPCTHVWQQTDPYWKRCTVCGLIEPLRK